jgi:hypothetical protein
VADKKYSWYTIADHRIEITEYNKVVKEVKGKKIE